MTLNDQDAEVGRLVRERHELRQRHAALLSKARQFGILLAAVGKALYIQPQQHEKLPLHQIAIENDGTIHVADGPSQRVRGVLLTTTELRSLLDEVTVVEQQLRELDDRLKTFGV